MVLSVQDQDRILYIEPLLRTQLEPLYTGNQADLRSFIVRILFYGAWMKYPPSTVEHWMICGLVLIDRVNADQIRTSNLLLLFLGTTYLSAKMLEDEPPHLDWFAAIGRMSINGMKRLEAITFELVSYRAHVSHQEYVERVYKVVQMTPNPVL